MNFTDKSKKLHLNDLSVIILIIGLGFVIGQLISYALVQLVDSSFFYELNQIKESETADSKNAYLLKLIQFVSALFTFVIPPLIIGKLLYKNIENYLKLNISPDITYYFLIVLFMFAIMPAMNIIIEWNESIKFPEWLSGMEDRMRRSEDSTQNMIKIILAGDRYFDLAVNILLIAAIPAIGEEFLFRGVIQKFLTDRLKNVHIAILISAFLFSAIHFQFFGLVPRFLLGAFFGYLVYYSKSLWPAIWAHFLNNAVAVTAMFYISKGDLSEKIEKIGTQGYDIFYVIIGLIITVFLGYFLFRKTDR